MQALSFLVFVVTFLIVPFTFNSCQSGFQSHSQQNTNASNQSPQQVLSSFCSSTELQQKTISKAGRYRQKAKVNIENLSFENIEIRGDEEVFPLHVTVSNRCLMATQTGFARTQFFEQMRRDLDIQSYQYNASVDTDLDALAETFEVDSCVLRVSPDRKMKFQTGTLSSAYTHPRPNDPFFTEQKHLNSIEAVAGFSLLYNPSLSKHGGIVENILVGVLDSGVDWSHPDLVGNLWNFTVTNSGTGLVEGPFYGVNATTLDPLVSAYDDYNPVDLVGHGTHVAGLIAAVTRNQVGVAGAAPLGVKIMAIKIHGPIQNSPTEGIYSSAVFNGARWAAARGVDVLNMSFGGYSNGPARDIDFEILFEELLADGVVVVVATGNGDGTNPRREIDNETFSVMPAVYGAAYSGVINVGATQAENKLLAPFSHYSTQFVEIAAPGTQVNSGQLPSGLMSTYPLGLGSNTGYDILGGTSQSAPLVAAAAAHVIRVVQAKTGSRPPPCLVEGILKYGSEKTDILRPYIQDGNHLNLRVLGEKLNFLFE
jgi:subtilisin family serine protease